MGQEATRTASMYRVVADRLAREGSISLTFDFHGTGDSPGDEGDQSLQAWTHDIESAHARLSEEVEVGVVWFAMGIMCHSALRAAARVARPPTRIILWEPVLNGAEYVDRLLAAHRQELTHEYHLPWARLIGQGRVQEPQIPGEVLGFDVGESLAAELKALPPLPLAPVLRRGTQIRCGMHSDKESTFQALPGSAQVQMIHIAEQTNWMLSQAMGNSIVPPEVFVALNDATA